MDRKWIWGDAYGMGGSTSRHSSRRKTTTQKPLAAAAHEYEVFLSFMGEDTRKKFTDHLYHRMVDAGVFVFKDNVDLPYGEEIARSLSEAIKKSRVAMPILSANYAASRWCLDELVCMMECRNTRNQTVMPIFYDVTPSQVRHQTGSYETAFMEHVKNYEEEVIQKWRKALAEVTSLKGLELEKETAGHEGLLTKQIVVKVLIELKKPHLRVTDKLVGISDQEKAVKDLLEMSSQDVRKVVGLWGMGGIGKTTLAKHIYNQIWDKFESWSFLSDIRERSLGHGGLAQLQTQLVSDLSKQQHRVFSSVDEGVNELQRKFREKKVLILLDDADDMDQIEALAANLDWFGPGSRILLTTRNREILDDLLIEAPGSCYEVNEMDQKKALQLFCNHAFRQDTPEDEFSEISHAIVETTGGLPLALEVLGSFLYRKGKSIWEESLKQLRQSPKRKVQERLRISYDRLEDEQKQMFLDVACLFIGEDINAVIYVWKDRYLGAEYGKDVLLLLSLIKIVGDDKIWMHDQLRDLGREIVRNENCRHPEKRSRLWQEDEARKALDNSVEHGSSEVEALCLRNHTYQDYRIRSFPNIWFLKLDDVSFDGNFQNLLPELRWLGWRFFLMKHSPTNLNLEKLLVLDLSSNWDITDDSKLWSSFQGAKKLKVLNLSSCNSLSTLDVSIGFINLERLVLDNCLWLKEISSIGKLEKLLLLSMKKCCNIKKLPDSIGGLKSLRELDLSGNDMEIEGYLPDTIGSLTNLQRLTLAKCVLKEEHWNSIGKLKSLRELDLSGANISTLPSYICDLENLQALIIVNSPIRSFPNAILDDMIDHERRLHIMDTFMCECLKGNNIRKYQRTIGSIYLRMIKWLNGSESLHILKFSGATCYKHPEMEEALELDVIGCGSIEYLPIPSGLKFLVRLDFHDCVKLQQVDDGLNELEALEELNIERCGEIKELPSLSKLRSLRNLNCSYCEKLQEIEGLHGLEALESFSLKECRAIEKLPSLSSLRSLKKLNFRGCENLLDIEGLDGLEALESFSLKGCRAIEKLPSLSSLRSLKNLNFRGCENLQDINEGLDRLEALEHFVLEGCTSIENLPSLNSLRSLKTLDFRGCEKLQEIEGLDRLEALETFYLEGCKTMRHIPVLPRQLKSKRGWLNLRGCESYEEIHRNHELRGSCSICQLTAEDLDRILESWRWDLVNILNYLGLHSDECA